MGDRAHDAAHWDARYAAEVARNDAPDPVVVELIAGLMPGRALDVACGLGRHARWLAAHGWAVTAVDYSAVGIARARIDATARHPRRRVASIREEPSRTPVSWVVADVRDWAPEPTAAAYELVLCAYVHLDPPDFARIRGWLAPGGRLVVVSHAPDAPDGPRNPAYRYDEPQLRAAAEDLTVERLDHHDRRWALIARRP